MSDEQSLMKAKVCVSEYDPFVMKVYDREETVDNFGEDYFDECAIELPTGLVLEYKEVSARFFELSRRIRAEKEAFLKQKGRL